MRPIWQWPHSVAVAGLHQGVSADSEITLVVPAARGEADGEEQWTGPMQRAAVTDTATEAPKNAWSRARAMDLTAPPPCPMVPRDPEDNTFKEELQATLKEQQSVVFDRGLPRRQRERSTPPKAQQLLAWLRRAPQGRAPSGSGGKRRTLVSWIRLASSLEETKRKGARWAAFYLPLKG